MVDDPAATPGGPRSTAGDRRADRDRTDGELVDGEPTDRGCGPLRRDATGVHENAAHEQAGHESSGCENAVRENAARGGSPTARGDVSDAWLVGRARELNAASQQNGSPEEQRTTIDEADELLVEARHRGEPRIVAQLLRQCASMRLNGPDPLDDADELLDELLTHSRRHGLLVLQADARALRGRRALLSGSEDVALSETAGAMAILDEELVPDTALGRRSWERLLASSLIDIGLVLTQLGINDMADKVMARAHQRIRESGGPHEIAVHMINRCRMLLGWGFRLERVGEYSAASGNFVQASTIALAAEGPWQDSLFPRMTERAAEQMPVLGAAHALADPGPRHVGTLRSMWDAAGGTHPQEKIILTLALARCLEAGGRAREAVSVLVRTRDDLQRDTAEPTLRLSLLREHARLAGLEADDRGDAVRDYALELENELWTMRETRLSTLLTRLEHEKLDREHTAITRQALQDPLTGLNNRRALDDRLDTLLESAEAHPLAVALLDLDGFKEVNDRSSHAQGDEVLRVVASTLRDTLRTDDFLARYGGDEFVVLLPGATLSSAESALGRAVDAVSRLPAELSRGVTLSIGVVPIRPHDSGPQVLARADAAMYEAKRMGGNRVAAVADDRGAAKGDDLSWTPPKPR